MSLNAKKIYEGDELGRQVFHFFKSLRNKHMVHDENSYTQGIPGAILNKRDMPHKIEKIVTLNMQADTLCQENYNNLHNLISTTRDWVVAQYDEVCDRLTTELESQGYDDLFTRESIEHRAPTVDEIHVARATV